MYAPSQTHMTSYSQELPVPTTPKITAAGLSSADSGSPMSIVPRSRDQSPGPPDRAGPASFHSHGSAIPTTPKTTLAILPTGDSPMHIVPRSRDQSPDLAGRAVRAGIDSFSDPSGFG